ARSDSRVHRAAAGGAGRIEDRESRIEDRELKEPLSGDPRPSILDPRPRRSENLHPRQLPAILQPLRPRMSDTFFTMRKSIIVLAIALIGTMGLNGCSGDHNA